MRLRAIDQVGSPNIWQRKVAAGRRREPECLAGLTQANIFFLSFSNATVIPISKQSVQQILSVHLVDEAITCLQSSAGFQRWYCDLMTWGLEIGLGLG